MRGNMEISSFSSTSYWKIIFPLYVKIIFSKFVENKLTMYKWPGSKVEVLFH